jgi:predicted HNH restriction endonuclease
MYDAKDYPRQSAMATPILLFVAEKGGAIDFSNHGDELAHWLAERFKLSVEQRNRTDLSCHAKGHRVWVNHIQQARRKLVARGLLNSSRRKVWQMTPLGYDHMSSNGMLTDDIVVTQAANAASNQVEFISDDEESFFPEGKANYLLHRKLERDNHIVQLAKQKRLIESGRLVCEICEFDFSEVYGEIGKGFIEAHHTKPVSEICETCLTKINDLVLVCPNCHRMLHRRRPWLCHGELKNLLRRP